MRLRARLHRAGLGEGRGHLPDLPRPLPQRPHEQRPEDRRRPLRRPGPRARRGARMPEGYCRNYADGATNCPWRFDTTPPADSPTMEQPRGRDYMGGDLKGVDQQLDYLAALGVNTIYFNPIFDAGSNHSLRHAGLHEDRSRTSARRRTWTTSSSTPTQLGIRIILDGVFNHMSSDSPFFDRYHHYADGRRLRVGDLAVPLWFTFHDVAPGTGTCVGSTGVANGATYDGWFGFDSIPVLTRASPTVQEYFLTEPGQRSRSAGSRPAPPAGGWTSRATRRSRTATGRRSASVVKTTDPDALTISETWQKDSTLLRMLRGDRLDTTMNYRLRDAVLGLLAPAASTRRASPTAAARSAPSEFAARLASQPRGLPGRGLLLADEPARQPRHRAAALDADAGRRDDRRSQGATPATSPTGKLRVRLASLIQFTVPGAPTVYYGDEVGLTGDDDPDDRRTYPWADLGGSPDTSLLAHYTALAALRDDIAALTDGDFRVLLADDADETVAYGRKTDVRRRRSWRSTAAPPSATLTIPVGGYLPDGIALDAAATASATAAIGHGRPSPTARSSITLPALSARRPRDRHVDLDAAGGAGGPARHRRGGERASSSPGTPSPARPATTSTSARSRAAATSRPTTRRSPARPSPIDGPRRTPARLLRASSARSTPPATRAPPRTRSSALPHLDDRLGQPPVAADADPHDQRPSTGPTTSTARSGSTA